MKTAIPKTDREALRYAGMLGHTHVIVIDDGSEGRRCPYQGYAVDAVKRATEPDYAACNPVVYRQVKPGEWKPVRLRKARAPGPPLATP